MINVSAGERFGSLTVISEAPKDRQWNRRWHCKCDCGNELIVRAWTLKSGQTKSCGCSRILGSTAHDMSRTREYAIWTAMKQRCSNPKAVNYSEYGGRGIRVCPRWVTSFETFYADMGPRPSRLHSIERRDVNGIYEPANCYWATKTEQMNNRRNNVLITIHGETMTRAQVAIRYGINVETLRNRLRRGMSPEEAVQK